MSSPSSGEVLARLRPEDRTRDLPMIGKQPGAADNITYLRNGKSA
jgi:hypothetical protein